MFIFSIRDFLHITHSHTYRDREEVTPTSQINEVALGLLSEYRHILELLAWLSHLQEISQPVCSVAIEEDGRQGVQMKRYREWQLAIHIQASLCMPNSISKPLQGHEGARMRSVMSKQKKHVHIFVRAGLIWVLH